MSEDLYDPIYAVAVSTGPVTWVIHCEICDEEFGEPTADEIALEELEAAHLSVHGLSR